METFTGTALSAWASYLINNDSSGISNEDTVAANKWCDRYADGLRPVDCQDAGFVWHPDSYNEMACGGDCQHYTFLRL